MLPHNKYQLIKNLNIRENIQIQGVPTSMVSTSTISTSAIFIAIGIKSVLVEFSRIGYVVKFVLVEITM